MKIIDEVSYDKNTWDITKSSNGYRIVNKISNHIYLLSGKMLGIKQVENTSFLVFYYTIDNEIAVARLWLIDGYVTKAYCRRFNTIDFINEDIILFDKDMLFSSTLYSIKKNAELSDLLSKLSQMHNVRSHEIKLVYDDANPKFLKWITMTYRIHGNYSPLKEYIHVYLSPESLRPTQAYSSLRRMYFNLSRDISLKQLFEEDIKTYHILDDFVYKSFHKHNN